ncbi:hypothetical protein H8356DRAFT_1271562 [Neocallimastix lanati (nom. inval.)]|nr:hypothetical protein H8356DRAFT_1271562 [Neocallimastix sp. JGI-2020a]
MCCVKNTGTLPRIGGSCKAAEIWKFKINNWFNREGITTDENKFSYIIAAAEDYIVRVLMKKGTEENRALTLDELHNFNTKYLDLYDQLETEDKTSISVIDYVNALLPRTQIYIRITMEEYSCLEDSYSKAEKYENILQESHWRNERTILLLLDEVKMIDIYY